MFVVTIATWEGKDGRDIIKRFAAWAGPPEGVKIVGAWSDVAGRRCFFLHDVADPAAFARNQSTWAESVKLENVVVLPTDEYMKVLKEEGWF
jgi:hypothetical protein